MTDAEELDCPVCKADGFEVCDHTEPERIIFRAERAARHREKRHRRKANERAARRDALYRGDVWL